MPKSEISRTLFGFQNVFQLESYPNVIILALSSPLTFESQAGQKDFVCGSVHVPYAEPPMPWTKIMVSCEIDAGGRVGSTMVLSPSWLEVDEGKFCAREDCIRYQGMQDSY